MTELPETYQLLETMSDLEAQIDELGARDPVSEAVEARLRALCEAHDARFEWTSIVNRVDRGTQTWQRVWSHPRLEEGEAGVALVRAAVTDDTRDAVRVLADLEPSVQAAVDEHRRNQMRRY